jgi:hypothetical protein
MTSIFDYDFNGEQKRCMIVGQIVYAHYKVNILYEDIEGSDEKFIISTNIRDFFDDKDKIEKIKKILRQMLSEMLEKEYMDVKWKIPKWLQKMILDKFDRI